MRLEKLDVSPTGVERECGTHFGDLSDSPAQNHQVPRPFYPKIKLAVENLCSN